ncbi:conserved hypothetical protein [Verticillium alfalfae VaMs.102]|uniref:Uncharacterized protein n=1 Tax=Verticillium alfalfae (strain VaMs.102 / ATCC MYA-4576 / FGSC 10136) TaxID=526221 RepID=C9SE60_VERA1|nr:conserved hypothetical protein [Verticillium alfalfae VaMs.102]EEY16469.1 conserved hypothetical protein [Verticillium alfalfae VaMs.102]
MSFLRALPLVIGTVALLATAANLIVHIVLATHISRTSPVQAAAGVSAALEGLVLIILAWSYSRYVFTARAVSSRSPVVVFGISLAACVVATAASIAAVVCLSKTASDLPHSVMGADQNSFLVGSSTVLGLSFACQIIFIILHFVWAPVPHHRGGLHHADEPRRLPQMHVTVHPSTSPGFPLDLVPPPPVRRRSRSFSPARRPQSNSPELEGSGEANIHPLFRSDSPVPPPNVTPGTVVVASPNAGQVISDRKSVRRMRSSSLANGQSPLSHQSSFEFLPSSSVNEQDEVEEQSEIESPSERKMTPPIPEWILTAGSRSSLTGYQSRKLRIDADPGC